MGYSWIIKPINPFKYKSIEPIKMLDMDIIELNGNFQMFRTRREALEELKKDFKAITIRATFDEFNELPLLKWSDKDCTLWKYIQSRLVVLGAPIFIIIAVPIFRESGLYQIRRSYKLNPEWWV